MILPHHTSASHLEIRVARMPIEKPAWVQRRFEQVCEEAYAMGLFPPDYFTNNGLLVDGYMKDYFLATLVSSGVLSPFVRRSR